MEFKEFYNNKNILITGAAGTIGRQIARLLLECEPEELRLMDNNETEIFFLMEEYSNANNVHCFLGDVRDFEDVRRNYSDISKAKRVLGYEPNYDLDKGLKATFEYFKNRYGITVKRKQ